MQLYFANCLVGFLAVVATLPTTSARVPSFYGSFAEQAEIADSDALGKPLLEEPANELVETIKVKKPNQKKKKHLSRYVEVELAESDEDLVIQEGQSYVLSCTVHAFPQASVHWIRGGNVKAKIAELLQTSVAEDALKVDPNRIAKSHARYVIDCASEKDAGPIHCVGISGQQVDFQSTTIVVEENNKSLPPTCKTMHKPVITSNLGALFSLIGSTVVVPCEAKGFPTPKTRWTNSLGVDLANNKTNSDHYTFLETGELIIHNLVWEDMDNYKCIAEALGYTDVIETFIYPMAPS